MAASAAGLTVDAPELRPDRPATVVVRLVNDDVEPYEGVELSLAGPWAVTPLAPGPDRLEPGESAEATWAVTARPSASPPRRASSTPGHGSRRWPARRPRWRWRSRSTWSSRSRPLASTEAHFGARGDRLAVIAGGADLWTGVDEYGALFLPGAAGAATEVVTQLVSQDPTDPDARAGLALRNDLTGAGRAAGYVLLVAKPENGFLLLWDADGSGTVESVARSGPPATPSPAWLRLTRDGDTFTGAWSPDGVAWTTVGTERRRPAGRRPDRVRPCRPARPRGRRRSAGHDVIKIHHDELATRHDKCIDSRAVIDRASSEPLHAQLRQSILDAIADGRWRPGDRLPSESELCRQFDISRTTVRQALTMLELEGALRREQGRGTFVAEPAPSTGFLQSSAGFQEDAERDGHVVTSQVLKVAVERMPSWAASGLEREPETHGVWVERVRSIDGQVVMFADTWILLEFAEGVLAADLSRESLYHVLRDRHGVVVQEGRRSVQAVMAEPRVAQLLEVPEGSPVLYVEAVTSDRAGRPFECYRAWHRTDRSRLEIRVEGG